MSWDAYLIDDRGHNEGDWNYTPMTEAQTAWLAGLLEGEGCFRLRKVRGRVRGNPDVQINMTDEDVVRKAHCISRIGTFHGPYQQPGNRKPFWVWKVSSSRDALMLMRAVYPWMGDRRQAQINDIITEWDAQPPATSGRTLRSATWRAA